MTAHPQKLASDAAETLDVPAHSSDAQFLAHVDDLERAGRAMIDAGKAQIDAGKAQVAQGSTQLEICRALRNQRRAAEAAEMAGDLVSVANVAKILGKSKAAIRMKVFRMRVGVKVGASVHIHRGVIGSLYA
jgi:predicted TIM-barrel fold metal-dependent hydrolase